MLLIAHRGDSAHHPENTLTAFASAIAVGADHVELDVQLTRDGELVVIHDATLDRTTSGSGRVAQHTLAEIRSLSAGYPERFGDRFAAERVPTLDEAFALLRGRARVMIEIKPESVTGAPDGVEARVVAAVARARMTGDVGVASFDPRALAACRRLMPALPRATLFSPQRPADVVAVSLEVAADLALPHKSLLSAELVVAAGSAGLRLGTWVVDDPAELADLAPYRLDGLASNDPRRILPHLGRGTGGPAPAT